MPYYAKQADQSSSRDSQQNASIKAKADEKAECTLSVHEHFEKAFNAERHVLGKSRRWIWIDLEMTGLNWNTNTILEVALLVTDHQLNIIAEFPGLAIYQPDEILNKMDEWNTNTHTKSGLVARVKSSRHSMADAEAKVLKFLQQHTEPHTSPMCGSTICQDRRFLELYMPTLNDYFREDNLDVSTLKSLAKCWAFDILPTEKREPSHLALDDIRDSLDLLSFLREKFFLSAHR